ncbi:hypothetical protein PDE_09317 [Penicillium oxalicum 114-2]|uniref:Uncharacterized protein n=1 Tax=Penicillium oxalicum (strain 114-2 / CGMCC 5302) TaxID=933388 RepID=S8B658_PENO1|nr:hypothetical protein PDE_09317 [Penicillium oxalicum 114-2]
MVSTTDNNPLVPKAMQTRNSLSETGRSAGSNHRLNDEEMALVGEVAPSSQSTCAELAHDHALEDLHRMTDHVTETDDELLRHHGTQCELGGRPEE